MDILNEIIKHKINELDFFKNKYHFINDLSLRCSNKYSLIKKIESSKKISIIAEIKKGSPSKGIFAPNLDPVAKAKEYEISGASCVSVLTDEKYFFGSFEILGEIRKNIELPILCKDFIIDEFQIKLAKYFGANVILLIKRILDDENFLRLLNCAKYHNLEVLVEVNNVEEFNEIKYHDFIMCGVNNRNLSDFTIDLNNTKIIAPLAKQAKKILISESGIYSQSQVLELRKSNIDGLLVGESIVTDKNLSLIKEFQVMKKRTLVKICGIKDLETALHVEKYGADFIGFVFAESNRKVDVETVKNINKHLKSIKSVGVFLNNTPEEIQNAYYECRLDFAQIYGDTCLDKVNIPKDKIIPSMPYDEKPIDNYEYILIDGKNPGSGNDYNPEELNIGINQKFFLAGGLNQTNITEKIKYYHPDIVDVSSGVETNGIKDLKKIKKFIETVGGI